MVQLDSYAQNTSFPPWGRKNAITASNSFARTQRYECGVTKLITTLESQELGSRPSSPIQFDERVIPA